MAIEAVGRRLTAIVRTATTSTGRGAYRGDFVLDRRLDVPLAEGKSRHRHFTWTPEPDGTDPVSTLGCRRSAIMRLELRLQLREIAGTSEAAALFAVQAEVDHLLGVIRDPTGWQSATSTIRSAEFVDVRFEALEDDDAIIVAMRFRVLHGPC